MKLRPSAIFAIEPSVARATAPNAQSTTDRRRRFVLDTGQTYRDIPREARGIRRRPGVAAILLSCGQRSSSRDGGAAAPSINRDYWRENRRSSVLASPRAPSVGRGEVI